MIAAADVDADELRERLRSLGLSEQAERAVAICYLRALPVPELRAMAERYAAATTAAELSLIGEVLSLRAAANDAASALDVAAKVIEDHIAKADETAKRLRKLETQVNAFELRQAQQHAAAGLVSRKKSKQR